MKTIKHLLLLLIILLTYSCSSDSEDKGTDLIVTCDIPSLLEAVDITSNSAIINWTESTNTINYIIIYGESGFSPNVIDGLETSNNSFSILNLTSNTSYDIYIKAVCNMDTESELSQVLTIVTPCDNLTFQGDVILNTQQELNEFGANCYKHIEGSLTIGSSGSNISSLAALNNLTTISDYLNIEENSLLTSLEGLEGLEYIEFGLAVINNDNLESLNGIQPLLQAMDVFYEVYISDNDALTNLNLEDLTSCVGVYIYNNNSLSSLNSLNNLISALDILAIRNNNTLNDFCDLQNLFTNGNFDLNLIDIGNNLYNPTVEDIVNGDCSQ